MVILHYICWIKVYQQNLFKFFINFFKWRVKVFIKKKKKQPVDSGAN